MARVAGVSWATVSNVLNNHPNIRAGTRARVEAAIQQLGYRPSAAGRELRGAPSRLLSLVVPDIESPYFSHLAHALIAYAETLNFTVLITETGGNIEREQRAIRPHSERNVQGTIFSPLSLSPDDIEALREGAPVVALGEHLRDDRLDHVAIDNITAARQATEHLLATGRRRIAFMGYQPRSTAGTGDLRLQGHRDALAAEGIELDDSLVIETGKYIPEEGEAKTLRLIEDGVDFDALLCANDLLAVGALRQLRLHGISVPNSVAVVGFDNTPEGRYCWPALTTIAPDIVQLAHQALDVLIMRIAAPGRPPSHIVVPYELIERESSTPPSPSHQS
ncbi:LacI family DNA-binding transcriptional regulator [Lacisediminihabitans sp. FW035]